MRVIIVQFSELTRWDVKSFFVEKYRWDQKYIYSLHRVLRQYRERLEHNTVVDNGYRIISKINFAGELFLRNFEDVKKYKGNLFFVPNNAVIFSKINVRHGCVYVHINGNPFAVSNEYPVLTWNESKVVGEYLNLALRNRIVKAHLQAKAVGMAKPRTSLAEFLELTIPVPSIEKQRKIVQHYHDLRKQAHELREQARQKEQGIDDYLLQELGIKKQEYKKKKGAFVVRFKDLERWDVSYNKNEILTRQKAKYEWQKLRNFCTLAQYGYTESSTTINTGVRFLRITDIDYMGNYDMQSLPFVRIKETDKEKYLLNKGDFLIARTGATAGKSCIAKVSSEDVVFASYLIRFRFNSDIDLQFLEYYLNQGIGRKIINDTVYSSAQPNINANQMQEIKIPLPPLQTQKSIVKHIEKMRADVANLRTRAAELEKKANDDVEKAIIGI